MHRGAKNVLVVFPIGPGQLRPGPIGPDQVGPGQVGPGQVGLGQTLWSLGCQVFCSETWRVDSVVPEKIQAAEAKIAKTTGGFVTSEC